MLTTSEPSDKDAFDPEWYVAAFPDVPRTGMAPWDHFRKYGRKLGRAPNGAAAEDGTAQGMGQGMAQGMGQGDEIARPEHLPEAADALVSVRAGEVEIGRFRAEEGLKSALAPVAAYRTMLGLEPGVFTVTGASATGLFNTTAELGADLLRTGPLRLEAIWFADAARLRLSLDGSERASHIRLYQAVPEAPGVLIPVGGGEIQGAGPHLVDAPLCNPMMPVLIEVAGADGLTDGFALLPFPSLVRGGLHGAERAAWAKGRDPLADLWRLSGAYLAEMRGRGHYAIGAVVAEALPAPVEEALAALFGFGGARTGALELELGSGQVPTLAALTSRRLALPAGQAEAAGPFLVADETGCRPRWSVALPAGDGTQGADVPVLRKAKGRRTTRRPVPGNWLAPLHLAIAFRPPEPVTDILTFLPAAAPPAAAGIAVTAVLKASDPALAGRALAALSLQEGVEIQRVLLQIAPETAAEDQIVMMAEGLFPERCQVMPPEAGLDALEAAAEGAALLLMDEAVLPYDPATLAGLAEMLAGDAKAGSVAPALLHEAEFRKGTRVQLASAGLFPMALDFTAGPRLAVALPDVLSALPRHSYPVIANSFGLCLIRRAAITATAEARAGFWGDATADVKFGLDAYAAGWRHLATTRIRAGTTALPIPRDEIDPMGLACLLPDQWASLVAEVTLVRELRG